MTSIASPPFATIVFERVAAPFAVCLFLGFTDWYRRRMVAVECEWFRAGIDGRWSIVVGRTGPGVERDAWCVGARIDGRGRSSLVARGAGVERPCGEWSERLRLQFTDVTVAIVRF